MFFFSGGPCKHQHIIVKKFGISSWNAIPDSDPLMKELLYKVATGCSVIPPDWFLSLRQAHSTEYITCAIDSVATTNGDRISEDVSILVSSCGSADMSTQACSSKTAGHVEKGELSVIDELRDFMSQVEERCRKDPQALVAPLAAFTKRGRSLLVGTESALASAFYCFGRYTGAAVALGQKKGGLLSLKSIGVQPTATARRKMLGGGKRHKGSGRPLQVGGNSRVSRKLKAPHNVGVCVSRNSMIGKRHSAQ